MKICSRDLAIFTLLMLYISFCLATTAQAVTSFVGPTPADTSTIHTNSATINISQTGTNPYYSALDINRQILLNIPMDILDGSNNPLDNSSYAFTSVKYGNAAQTTQGKFGKGFSFDGTNSYINTTFILTSNDFTVSLWVNASAFNSSLIICDRDGVNDGFYIGRSATANYTFSINTLAGTSSFNDISGAYRHLVLTFSNSTNGYYGFYVDGVLDRSGYTATQLNVANFLKIGTRSFTTGSSWFKGSVDDVIVFNRSLSSSEILSLYNSYTTPYTNTFSNLADGNYTIYGSGWDTPGNFDNTPFQWFLVDYSSSSSSSSIESSTSSSSSSSTSSSSTSSSLESSSSSSSTSSSSSSFKSSTEITMGSSSSSSTSSSSSSTSSSIQSSSSSEESSSSSSSTTSSSSSSYGSSSSMNDYIASSAVSEAISSNSSDESSSSSSSTTSSSSSSSSTSKVSYESSQVTESSSSSIESSSSSEESSSSSSSTTSSSSSSWESSVTSLEDESSSSSSSSTSSSTSSIESSSSSTTSSSSSSSSFLASTSSSALSSSSSSSSVPTTTTTTLPCTDSDIKIILTDKDFNLCIGNYTNNCTSVICSNLTEDSMLYLGINEFNPFSTTNAFSDVGFIVMIMIYLVLLGIFVFFILGVLSWTLKDR